MDSIEFEIGRPLEYEPGPLHSAHTQQRLNWLAMCRIVRFVTPSSDDIEDALVNFASALQGGDWVILQGRRITTMLEAEAADGYLAV